jgi:ribonuclease E
VGGIIVIDFIDMVLESNRELVLRRLLECLARDRTKHQVAEVTSLGLVQMTRKRVGAGLLEAFSEPCECCNGRGVIVSLDLIDRSTGGRGRGDGRAKEGRQTKNGKNGKESGRRTREPAAARKSGDEDADGAASGEAGAEGTRADGPAGDDGAGADGAWADGAGADGSEAAGAEAEAAQVDGPEVADAEAEAAGVDGPAAAPPSGARRRTSATREQGPPEPVGQPAEPAAG